MDERKKQIPRPERPGNVPGKKPGNYPPGNEPSYPEEKPSRGFPEQPDKRKQDK